MNKTSIIYYQDRNDNIPFKEFLNKLNNKQKAKILRIFYYIEEYGLIGILPHTKKLIGYPLWEIRILGNDNIRIIYIIPMKNNVLILHGFIKKKQKTPSKEIQISLFRYNDWIKRFKLDK